MKLVARIEPKPIGQARSPYGLESGQFDWPEFLFLFLFLFCYYYF